MGRRTGKRSKPRRRTEDEAVETLKGRLRAAYWVPPGAVDEDFAYNPSDDDHLVVVRRLNEQGRLFAA